MIQDISMCNTFYANFSDMNTIGMHYNALMYTQKIFFCSISEPNDLLQH